MVCGYSGLAQLGALSLIVMHLVGVVSIDVAGAIDVVVPLCCFVFLSCLPSLHVKTTYSLPRDGVFGRSSRANLLLLFSLMGNESCMAETVYLSVACGRGIRGGGLACCVRDVGSGFRCGFYCLGYSANIGFFSEMGLWCLVSLLVWRKCFVAEVLVSFTAPIYNVRVVSR